MGSDRYFGLKALAPLVLCPPLTFPIISGFLSISPIFSALAGGPAFPLRPRGHSQGQEKRAGLRFSNCSKLDSPPSFYGQRNHARWVCCLYWTNVKELSSLQYRDPFNAFNRCAPFKNVSG